MAAASEEWSDALPIVCATSLIACVDDEAEEFQQIRSTYLPELALAYNSILNYSAHFAGREILKSSMDLAMMLAEENSELVACLLKAGKMAEMVDSFTVVAKSMIVAESRKPGGKQKAGRTLGLWTTNVTKST